MDAEMLARIQFAFTVGYRFLIVPPGLGLALTCIVGGRSTDAAGAALTTTC